MLESVIENLESVFYYVRALSGFTMCEAFLNELKKRRSDSMVGVPVYPSDICMVCPMREECGWYRGEGELHHITKACYNAVKQVENVYRLLFGERGR